MTRSLLKVGVSAVLSAIFILLVIYRFLAIRSRKGEGEKKCVRRSWSREVFLRRKSRVTLVLARIEHSE